MLVAGLSCLIMNLSAPDNLWFVITLAMIGKLIILYTYHFIISTSTHQLVIVVVLNICTYMHLIRSFLFYLTFQLVYFHGSVSIEYTEDIVRP